MTHPYLPNGAPDVQAEMLAAVGVSELDELYDDVPAALRLDRPLDLPPALTAEQQLVRHVTGLLDKNRPAAPGRSFLGHGCYAHYVPAIVDEVIGRSEFLTAYAGEPYEDHGRFQALFEYESLMGELLSCDVVTVPTYDGYQATSTALAMTTRITGRKTVLMVSDVLGDKLSRVRDFLGSGVSIVAVPTVNATADVEEVMALADDTVAAIWVETPSATGAIEQALGELARVAHDAGALLVVGTDPICYGVLAPPATAGADITAGDIGSLGLHLYYGGAHGGFIAVADDETLVMQLPARLFGLAATDVPGEYGFGDVAYERTSFAKREEGVEWVGTAAALWGIAAGVYLSLMGPEGMAELGQTVLGRTRYAQQQLAAIDGVALGDQAVHFREFTVDVAGTGLRASEIIDALVRQGIYPGVATSEFELLVCVTEMNTKSDIDEMVAAVAGIMEEPK